MRCRIYDKHLKIIRDVKNIDFQNKEVMYYADEYEDNVANVNKTTLTQMSTDYIEWDEVYDGDKTKLFNLLVEYARTPIEDREEEKKFYAKHRHLVDFFTYDPVYLNYDARNKKIYVYDKKQTDLIQTQFTLKEYEEIKKKFNTDLKDFQLVEVEE